MSLPIRGPIPDAPYSGPKLLRRALVVIHFSPVLKIGDPSGLGIADFQDETRAEYPEIVSETEKMFQVEMRPDGLHQSELEMQLWRMYDLNRHWRTTLTRQSLALEVEGINYTNWKDYADRVHLLVEAVGKHFEPALIQRIGVRYVNAGEINGTTDPRTMCAPELVSISGEPELIQSDLLWRFPVDEGLMILRSGITEAGATYDPSVFEPTDKKMWYLDIDVLNTEQQTFDVANICAAILAQVRRAHAIYGWAVPLKKDDA